MEDEMRKRSFQVLIAWLLISLLASAPEFSGASHSNLQPRALAAPSFLDFKIYLPITLDRELVSPMLLPNDTWFLSPYGSLHVVGEVRNDTWHHLDSVKISAGLLDRNEQLLQKESAYTYLDYLPAGQQTCFDITFLDPPAGWTSVKLYALDYGLDGVVLPDVTLVNTGGEYIQDSGDYLISGQVRNDQGSRISGVKPVGTLYNAAGSVIGCELTYVDSINLNPGASSPYTIDFYGRNFRDVASFRVQVDGDY